ncbi:MAG TPA: tRNA (N(6)-L-threonylcarbamoyladenosine(37)-C(2))-methylthiotransferase MtaB [Bacteroidetes bacterium]|nr:tRNA (N(6)-L-threonylcarbamoyladenosine(37)-C(2))-methylthiotransferase MtaB [Bacteroidota bacterium]
MDGIIPNKLGTNNNNINKKISKVFTYTFGCKVNYSESSRIADEFAKNGIHNVENVEDADIVVINTCSVTQKADADARKAIRHSLNIDPNKFIIVTGCAAEINPYQFADIEGVDLVLGSKSKFHIPDYIDTNKKLMSPIILDIKADNLQFEYSFSSENDSRTRAVLKIQDGCEYNCSYCIIPQARGNFRSMPFADIIPTIHKLEESGYSEITLVGINLAEYHSDDKNFRDVLMLISQSKIHSRIRMSSIEPNILDEEIIRIISQSENICPHFHIPLQSGSEKVLRLMRRRYNKKQFEKKILTINKYRPDAAIGLDIITGFPGESDAEFAETQNFLNNLPLTYLHVFSYSERPNTDALKIPNKVPEILKKQRTNILRQLSGEKSLEFFKKQLNMRRDVLFEYPEDKVTWFGHSDNYIPVIVKSNKVLRNKILKIKLDTIQNGKVLGEITE